jgi:hypothetical protein
MVADGIYLTKDMYTGVTVAANTVGCASTNLAPDMHLSEVRLDLHFHVFCAAKELAI